MSSTTRHLFLILVFLLLLIILYVTSHQKSTYPNNFSSNSNSTIQIPTPILPPNLEGPFLVVKVDDGDTIVVSKNNHPTTIRFVGIDTPEVSGPYRQQACWGPEASQATHKLLDSQSVYLQIDNPKNLIDKYGRELRYVYRASDHLFVSQYLVEQGFAREYSYKNITHLYQTEFRASQNQAKSHNLGLWGHCKIN